MKRNTFDPRNIVFLGTYRKMLVFYFWRGRYCVRTVSSLSGKRVKKAPEFKVTMQYAKRLGRASKIASKVYRQLPDGWKLHDLYRKMTGVGANLLKKQEHTPEELEAALWQYLASVGFAECLTQNAISLEVRKESDVSNREQQVNKTATTLKSRPSARRPARMLHLHPGLTERDRKRRRILDTAVFDKRSPPGSPLLIVSDGSG
ncbi:MAG: hypothetical protein QM731_21835 [Chitinophagaceae bacterium]